MRHSDVQTAVNAVVVFFSYSPGLVVDPFKRPSLLAFHDFDLFLVLEVLELLNEVVAVFLLDLLKVENLGVWSSGKNLLVSLFDQLSELLKVHFGGLGLGAWDRVSDDHVGLDALDVGSGLDNGGGQGHSDRNELEFHGVGCSVLRGN